MKQFVLNKSWIPTLINKKLTISNHICFLLVVYCATKISTSNLPYCACTYTFWELKEKSKKETRRGQRTETYSRKNILCKPFFIWRRPNLSIQNDLLNWTWYQLRKAIWTIIKQTNQWSLRRKSKIVGR